MLGEVGVSRPRSIVQFRVQGDTRQIIAFEEIDMCNGRLAGHMNRFLLAESSNRIIFDARTAEVSVDSEFCELVLAHPGEDGR